MFVNTCIRYVYRVKLAEWARMEREDDLVPDMIEVLTSFCARRYGRRSAKNKAKKAMEAIEHE